MANEFTTHELYNLMWSRPSFAQLEITRNCNQACVFCFDGCSNLDHYSDLSLDEWKYIVHQISKLGVHTLHFSGGESFLFKQFVELLAYSKSNGFSTHINTNGTIDISPTLPYVDEYVFSVHGLPELHDKIVRLPGSFDHVVNNIRVANAAGVPVYINTVLIQDNFEQISDLYRFFRENELAIHKFSFTLAAKSLSGCNFAPCALDMNTSLFQTYLSELRKIGRENLVLKHGMYALFDYDIATEPKSILFMPVCAAGKDKIIVKYNGDVFPCNFFQTSEYYCGNALNDNIHDIWENGKGYEPFRELVLNNKLSPECSECTKRFKCYGGCRIWTRSFYESGMFSNERDFRCALGNAFAGN